MTVTGITEVTKSRYKIETDCGFAFVLYKGELRLYGIWEGCELTQQIYDEIMDKLLPKRAKLRAMNLLKSRSYTRAGLHDKLRTGGYPEAVIEKALSYVESFGYVNDRQYAADYIEYNKERKSRKRILQDLLKRGISESLIREVWEENAGEEAESLEREQILSWLQKKNFSTETASFQEKQKMMAFLYRKGFKPEDIRSVLLLDITSI